MGECFDRLNGFFEFLQRDPLTPNAQLLYYTLLQINNRCMWKAMFFRTNESIRYLCGLKETAFLNARERLRSEGLIELYLSEVRGRPTGYRLKPFTAEREWTGDEDE